MSSLTEALRNNINHQRPQHKPKESSRRKRSSNEAKPKKCHKNQRSVTLGEAQQQRI